MCCRLPISCADGDDIGVAISGIRGGVVCDADKQVNCTSVSKTRMVSLWVTCFCAWAGAMSGRDKRAVVSDIEGSLPINELAKIFMKFIETR